jgi:hypothetical protein
MGNINLGRSVFEIAQIQYKSSIVSASHIGVVYRCKPFTYNICWLLRLNPLRELISKLSFHAQPSLSAFVDILSPTPVDLLFLLTQNLMVLVKSEVIGSNCSIAGVWL